MSINIRTIRMEELSIAVEILNHIPEFDAIFYLQQLQRRIGKAEHIIIIAEFAGKPIGCKIAYNRYFDGSIYSWLGGVLLPYRNQGVATELLKKLEEEARRKLFVSVRMKTRNKHKSMLRFALQHDFQIIGFREKDVSSESRIELKKNLL